MKSEIENIAAAWRRIFGVDLGRMRLAGGCSFVADHLAQFEGRSTPLVDAILAEIEFQAVRGRKPTKPAAEFIEFPMELIEFPEKPKESNTAGIGPGDVFRIFGNNANAVITDADWQEVPETNRREILDEAEDWWVRKTLSDAGLDESRESPCSHCKGPYAKRVKRTYANGKSDFCCHSCGRTLLGPVPKQRNVEALI